MAIHIRRGDKRLESPYVPFESYLKALRHLKDDLANVFVCSDDQRVVKDLEAQVYPHRGYRFFAIPCPTSQLSMGYDHRLMTQLSSRSRYYHTVRFLAELQMCVNARVYRKSSSNVGTFVSMLRSGFGRHFVGLLMGDEDLSSALDQRLAAIAGCYLTRP